ncbi:Serine aminopeptidase, S33 [Sesbania bispinosa]|nr:Serine aminopeptidase, S33 [Sesbania bispinosa]
MEQLVNFIIRPPRSIFKLPWGSSLSPDIQVAEYDPKSDLLDQEFMLKGKWYQRKDVEIKNSRGDVLQCSHYMPIVSPEGKPLPCVIYCHGNRVVLNGCNVYDSGCRADASEAAIILLPSNITVFTLDFSGSGLSGGEHVTLGWNEIGHDKISKIYVKIASRTCTLKDDLKAVVNYLRDDGNVSLIGLWGRSMGAVTSLMYGAEDPSIAGVVLDSPFSDLVDLMMELVDTYKVRLPKFTVKFAIQYMRRAIQKKAKFDIMDLNTIKVAKSCFVPALLGHAIDDDFIQPHHSDRIFEAYMGDKNIIKFEGDHNSPRPQFYFDSINIFFHNVLQPPEDEVGESFFDTVNDYFGKDAWRSVHELGYSNESSSKNKDAEPSTSSTIDAIKQVRSRRPMSRMEVPSDISSKDEHREHEEEKSGDLSPSSSSMISFELSNGHPYGPHVPTALDDDQYVEYQLDDLAGFPSSAEEEERMFMEAVMESLKDMEVQNPKAEEPPASSVSTISVDPSDKDDSHASSQEISIPMETKSSVKHNTDSKSKTISTASEECVQLKAEPNSISEGALLPPPPRPPLETLSATESSNTSGSASCDSSASLQSSSDTDISHNTKATVTVVRNPAGHVMDGLMRRWDFNFFRNSNNR